MQDQLGALLRLLELQVQQNRDRDEEERRRQEERRQQDDAC